jgi:mono/diheme cytochrome c family protein
MKTKSLQFFASLLILVGTACAPAIYTPSPSTVKDPTVKMEDLLAGRALYMDKCSSCHSLKQPKKFNAAEWNKILDKMAPKAKINDEQRKLVYQFVTNQK